MYPTNAYVIRTATDADADVLRRLAALDSQRPIIGAALIGEVDGAPAAAISTSDGRVVADPFQPTATLTQALRTRFRALQAHSRNAWLSARLHAAMAPFRARTGTA
jgi:hypothetical protein